MVRRKDLELSVYPDNTNGISEKITDYIARGGKLGYGGVFSSLHLPEVDLEYQIKYAKALSDIVKKAGMELTVDLSSHELRKILQSNEYTRIIKEAELDYLRLDFGFTAQDISDIRNKLGINGFVLNASVLSENEIVDMLEKVLSEGNDSKLKACHNFYPRPETGLSMQFMIDKSLLYKELNIPVIACVPSLASQRGPLFKGLPTVESHRYIAPDRSAMELIASGYVDAILVGDSFASDEELKAIHDIVESKLLKIRVKLEENISEQEKAIVIGSIHHARPDKAAYSIRSQATREMAQYGRDIPCRPVKSRDKYCITIDNRLYLRYSGELQIVTEDLPGDEKVNVAGYVIPEDTYLVKYIKPGSNFVLQEVNKT